MARALWILPVVLVVALPPAQARAQARVTSADLEGIVRDDGGAVLPGASVTAINMDTDATRTTSSDEGGRYLLAALPPGVYRVTAEVFGFGSQTRENVALLLGQAGRVDFSLRLSGAAETITVTDTAPILDARRSAVAYVIGSSQIESLPINGRNFISFSTITPGVVPDRASQGIAGTSGLSFTGQSSRANNVMVDGFDNNDSIVGGVRGLFSQEAIREFQVLTDSYSAEFGKASGGVVNIVTRGGTNELHGEAFAFFRDGRLNARDHFERFDLFGEPIARPKAPFRQWQWGATLGGPVRTGRTFFFLSFERSDTQANNFVNIDPVAAEALRGAGFPVELGQVPYDVEATQVLAKLDHQWSPRSSLSLRGSLFDSLDQNADPFGGRVARSAGSEQVRRDWFVSAAQTDVLSARWLNEARLQFSRFDQNTRGLDPGCHGPCDGDFEGGPLVFLSDTAVAGRMITTPAPRVHNRYQVADTVSYFAGSHLIKAGFDFEQTDTVSSSFPMAFGGAYFFSPLPGSVLALMGLPPRPGMISATEALSLGLPVAYTQGYGEPSGTGAYSYKELSVFVQDEWRLGSRLTLRTGLRYQRQLWPDRTFTVPDLGGAALTYERPQDRNDFAPRVGLSFDPRGDGRTSLHAGYGLFYADHISGTAGLAEIVDGADHVRLHTRLFPESVLAWHAPGRQVPEPAFGVPAIITVDPLLKTPFAHQAAVGVDQMLGNDFVLSANAIYLRGFNMLGTLEYNPLAPELGFGRRPNDIGGIPGTSGTLTQYTSYGESWYKGLAVSLSKRFSHGYQFLLSYTLSKAEDTVSDFAETPQDVGRGRNPADPLGLPLGFDPSREKGPSYNDQRHRLVLSGLYRLPWSLQVSAVMTAASGRPFTPLIGTTADPNGDGQFNDRARRVPSDPSSSVGRNSEVTEPLFNLDVRLSRRFRVGPRVTLEAICEAFNVFDDTSFIQPITSFGTGAFPGEPQRDAQGRVLYGRYERALPPRQVQLALRLGF